MLKFFLNLNGVRTRQVYDKYRPAHLVKKGYLRMQVHHDYGAVKVPSDGQIKGTITFLRSVSCVLVDWKENRRTGRRENCWLRNNYENIKYNP